MNLCRNTLFLFRKAVRFGNEKRTPDAGIQRLQGLLSIPTLENLDKIDDKDIGRSF